MNNILKDKIEISGTNDLEINFWPTMSVKLTVKSSAFRFLDKLPENLGYSIYHRFQDLLGKGNLGSKITSSQNSYSEVSRLTKKVCFNIENRTIIEIGSGWLPLMPYFFKFLDRAGEIRTYDINKHYSKRNIKKLNKIFSKKFSVQIGNSEGFNLPQGINYYPNTNLAEAHLEETDLVFSRFVLEHVRPEDIKRIHLNFIKNIPEAYVVHLISPSDHRAYVDPNLSLQDFLRYSQGEWDRIQTKFDYHNRLRLPQYIEIFETLGYEILHLEYEVPSQGSKSHQQFEKLNIHADYKKYTVEELMAGSINMVLKYK